MHFSRSTVRDDTGKRHSRKYESQNPIQQWLLKRFANAVARHIRDLRPDRILDFGCGEGYFWQSLEAVGLALPSLEVLGIDIRADAIEQARQRMPNLTFVQTDLFAFDQALGSFDLVIASQVMEHLYEPEKCLARLCELSQRWIMLTVPHEPYFRLSNLVRGRDVLRLGNHPEHVQQWGLRSFGRFASEFLEIHAVETVFPFIILLGRPLHKPTSSTHVHLDQRRAVARSIG